MKCPPSPALVILGLCKARMRLIVRFLEHMTERGGAKCPARGRYFVQMLVKHVFGDSQQHAGSLSRAQRRVMSAIVRHGRPEPRSDTVLTFILLEDFIKPPWGGSYSWDGQSSSSLTGKTSGLPISVTGRRLVAAAPPLMADGANGGYREEDWKSFMVVGINLPTLGCWEIKRSIRGYRANVCRLGRGTAIVVAKSL
jgi:hypothetical protein